MLCYVSLPDFVLKEFKIRDKARGQDLLEEVRCFVLLWAQSPVICFQSIFSDVTFFLRVNSSLFPYFPSLGVQKTWDN